MANGSPGAASVQPWVGGPGGSAPSSLPGQDLSEPPGPRLSTGSCQPGVSGGGRPVRTPGFSRAGGRGPSLVLCESRFPCQACPLRAGGEGLEAREGSEGGGPSCSC